MIEQLTYTGPLGQWGFIPQMLSPYDERSAQEQLHTGYLHGGGFNPFDGFALKGNRDSAYSLEYPGDPAMKEIGRVQLRDELIVLFEYEWVAVIQPDDTFVVARMD